MSCRYYFSKNSGLQNQAVIYSQATLEGDAVVHIDPNTLSEDGTVSLMGSAFSEDGKTYAYSVASGGSDWRTVKFLSVDQVRDQRRLFLDSICQLFWMHPCRHVTICAPHPTKNSRDFLCLSSSVPSTEFSIWPMETLMCTATRVSQFFAVDDHRSGWSIAAQKTGETTDLPDVLNQVKFSSMAWTHDHRWAGWHS